MQHPVTTGVVGGLVTDLPPVTVIQVIYCTRGGLRAPLEQFARRAG